MNKIETGIAVWRALGPADWSESQFGWFERGKLITLAPWQRAVLDAWFRHAEDVDTLAISNIKKTGKTFANGVLLAWRWLCLESEHFCVANDLDQSQGRQFRMITDMVKKHPLLKKYVKVTRSLQPPTRLWVQPSI